MISGAKLQWVSTQNDSRQVLIPRCKSWGLRGPSSGCAYGARPAAPASRSHSHLTSYPAALQCDDVDQTVTSRRIL